MSHILGGQQFGVVERVGGVSLNRDRSAEFINPVTRDWLVQRRAEVAGRIRETLEQLTPADLSRTIKVGNGETIVERWLLNIVSHFSGHLGQVILTRKLLDAQR